MGRTINQTIKIENDFYIHRRNIKTVLEENEMIVEGYNDYIGQLKTKINHTDLLIKFKNSFLESQSQKIETEKLKLLEQVMSEDFSTTMDAINEKLKEIVDKSIQKTEMEQLHKKVATDLKKVGLKSIINEDGVKKLNQLLEKISNIVDALNTTDSKIFAKGLLDIAKDSKGTLDMAKDLNITPKSALWHRYQEWLEQSEGAGVSNSELKSAKQYLSYFLQALATNKYHTSKEEGITAKGLSRILYQNFISTGLAEVIAIKADNIAERKIQTILTGSRTVKNEFYSKAIIGKTDIQLSNIEIKLNESETALTLGVGISLKFYTNQSFLPLTNKSNAIFETGSGGNLKEFINTITNNEVHKYFLYNDFTHLEHVDDLNNIILKSQFLRLVATAGRGDFADFIIMNGELVSVWELFKFIINENNSFTRSSSQDKAYSSQGLALSIPDRKEAYEQNEKMKQDNKITIVNRIHSLNTIINSTKITLKVHIQKLAELLYKK